MKRIIVGVTGATGSVYALRLLEVLLATGVEVHLVISALGRKVMAHELRIGEEAALERLTGLARGPENHGRLSLHAGDDLFAPIASGSFPADAMVVIPCSMKTLAAVANGYTLNLLERAADVCLKERRPLVLVTRESPLNRVHLSNMLKAHEAGAVIMPAAPGFYNHPETLDDLVDFVVSRVCDELKIEHPHPVRWRAEDE